MTQTEFCPYKGLQPYEKEDCDYFFGRKQDQKTIAANLVTARLTILYGVSGVGKTSVLQAGVVPFLQELPNVIVVVFREWQDDNFLLSLKTEITNAVKRTGQSLSADDEPLDDLLARAAGTTHSTLTIILDQFEEYFLYHPTTEVKNHFDAEFARAVNRDEVDANFLLSIREDSLARLDRFQGRIPNLFGNHLRLEHLDRESAREAIERPITDWYNPKQVTDEQKVNIEPDLVEAVLDQVKIGQVVLGEAGRGVVGVSSTSREDVRIEAPYLQLVMTRLWNEGPQNLQLKTLKRLGGAERIVKRHLDESMSGLSLNEQDVAARVFYHLVTPSGAKISHSGDDLAGYAELPEEYLAPVLEKLSDPEKRILRSVAPSPDQPPDQPAVPRYEIFHDVLAPAILDWRAQRARAREQRATLLRWGKVGLIVLPILAVLALLYWQATEARIEKEARIEFVSSILKNLDPDYEVPSDIALTLTASDVNSIVDNYQAGPTGSTGEEEEEEEEEEGAQTPKSLIELVEATYWLRILKNNIEFIPESPDRLRFQRISSHEHYRFGGDIGAYFKAMGTLGIRKAVFFPTGLSPDHYGYRENMEELLRLQELYPNRIIAFCTINEGDDEASTVFEDCLEAGGHGLKLIGGHPDFYDPENPNPLDSPTMMQVYEIADEHRVPVVIHINMIEFPELQPQFEHILEAFPDVPFVAAHYCKDTPPFELCAHLLDTYSNLYTDLSMGGALDRYLADISMHRDDYRDFILRYEDRILWGADLIIDDPQTKTADFIHQRISYDLYLLETGSAYDPAMVTTFQDIPKGAFALEDAQLFGLDLPEETLRNIYEDNPRRVLNLSD